MALQGYSGFGIFAEELSMLHTADEYWELCDILINLEIESITQYNNGYYLRFTNVKTPNEAPLLFAISTGDSSYLSADELTCYHKLLELADALCLNELSPIDAVVSAHDYLVLNTAYDMPAFESGQATSSHRATGTLLNGKAVCSGYASAFQLLMATAGIPCKYVYNDEHAWNLVQIDDSWYHIDVTWDDPVPDTPGETNYSFFMMIDDEIKTYDSHHVWTIQDAENILCTSTKYRLYPYRDSMCTNKQEALNQIISQLDQKEISLVYPVDGELNQDILLQLAMTYANDKLSYYPPTKLGDSHILLTIILQ